MAKKKRSTGAKGGQYEREICRRLSLWWTNEQRDDIFYRSDSSGARATSRNKLGKLTSGQYGDVAAIDPCGEPLVDLFTIELKRGYAEDATHGSKSKASSIHTVLDRLDRTKPTIWEEFIFKAIEDSEVAGSYSWLLISKRISKQDVIFMDSQTYRELAMRCKGLLDTTRKVTFRIYDMGLNLDVTGLLLDEFLAKVTRETIERMAEEL